MTPDDGPPDPIGALEELRAITREVEALVSAAVTAAQALTGGPPMVRTRTLLMTAERMAEEALSAAEKLTDTGNASVITMERTQPLSQRRKRRYPSSVRESVPFTVKSNPPTIVEVTALDGKRYAVELRLSLAEVADLGKPEPPQAVALEFKALIMTSIQPIDTLKP